LTKKIVTTQKETLTDAAFDGEEITTLKPKAKITTAAPKTTAIR